MKRNAKVLFMAQAAMIAAIYVVLTIIFAPVSFKEIQVRISEALTILPVFTPAAIPGLFIGCLLSNILGGCIVPDILLGSIATLIGAAGTYLLRRQKICFSVFPPILSNTLIIPFVLRYGYQVPLSFPTLMLTVGIGEIISCGILGSVLHRILAKYKSTIFK
ncbi:MAG: QueT transporter family protein [Schaedlerella sp.]|nr:QueT transporter family protein [Schaedlerella sp.]